MNGALIAQTLEIDAIDPDGIAMRLTVSIVPTLDRNGVYMATRTVREPLIKPQKLWSDCPVPIRDFVT
jgi:hypothetical protein